MNTSLPRASVITFFRIALSTVSLRFCVLGRVCSFWGPGVPKERPRGPEMADKGYLALFVNHAVEKTPSATPRGRRQASQRRMRFIYGGGLLRTDASAMAPDAADVPRKRIFRPVPCVIVIEPNRYDFQPVLVQIERRLLLLASPQMVTLEKRKIYTIPLPRPPG